MYQAKFDPVRECSVTPDTQKSIWPVVATRILGTSVLHWRNPLPDLDLQSFISAPKNRGITPIVGTLLLILLVHCKLITIAGPAITKVSSS